MSNKKYQKTTQILEEDTTEEILMDSVSEELKDETKLVEEFVNAKTEKNAPIYQIRTEWRNTSTQKQAFTDINEAIKECNKYAGYRVFNEDGAALHLSTAIVKMSSVNAVVYSGKKYELSNAKLFANATINVPKGKANGAYYLYDAKLINGRYRVVKNKNHVEMGIKFIEGYVAVEEMQ